MTKLFLAAGVAALAIAASATARPGDTARTTAKAERIKDAGATRRAVTERRAARTDLSHCPDRAQGRRNAPCRRQAPIAQAGSKPARPCVPTAARRLQWRVLTGPPGSSIARPSGPTATRSVPNDVNQGQAIALLRRQQLRADRTAAIAVTRAVSPRPRSSIAACRRSRPGWSATVVPATIAAATVPTTLRVLYPDTPDYYYRYGDGYMYRVDRTSNLIDALLPLLGGGYLPGQYLPANYMNSYVPVRLSALSIPTRRTQCTRYANGVVYYVDCETGTDRELHAALRQWLWRRADAAGELQLLQRADQYRSMYYDTPTPATGMRRARSTSTIRRPA